MSYALLTPSLAAIQIYPVTIDAARAAYPEIRGVSMSGPDPFYPRLVAVAPTAKPAVLFGETLTEATPIKVGAVWTQVWGKTRITLAEAKAELRAMAVEVYWSKTLEVATPAELGSGGSFIGVIQERELRFGPKVLDVRTRIQAAATIDAAKLIYDELVDLV